MSSFRRFSSVTSLQKKKQLPGTKSWLYGQSIISTGCKDLDNACGSGIPLGSIVIISEDSFIHQAKSFTKLFMAEGIQCKQRILYIANDSEQTILEFLRKLPAKKEEKQVKKEETKKPQVPATSAWQYGKYLSQSKSIFCLVSLNIDASEPLEYCHTFDFSKSEEDISQISFLSLSSIQFEEDSIILSSILSSIHQFIHTCKQADCVGRIVLSIDELLSDNTPLQIQLFSRVRQLIRGSTCVLYNTLFTDLNTTTLYRYGDCILDIQPWQGRVI